ncbi:MAG TPA: hypothetical protein PKW75_02825 [candidate division Zixibacteria bacterium]|nr:hypothetical protein [candidate division Zixibacteria bacterium]MDD4916537.1 hypothetical protein [candidate division Zixibacteria bacterium]MDM7974235.1 hypothetical protein [candidate division Zixibacteria bacterium]HOD66097.1 hypothetical protein [candidate division Zixibacteria bacterium]HOZ07198.1 hypothetical protein [candidate division Zixibacteria bacterium]
MRQRHALAAILSAALVAGCAVGPRVVDTWRDPAYTGPAFKKIAVVGITDRESSRRIFETAFAATLREQGVAAVPSYDVYRTDEKMPREEIERLVRENGIDAIITARVVDRTQRIEITPATALAVPWPAHYRGYYGFYDYAWAFYHDPGYVTASDVVSIETNVYETSGFNIVWTGTSRTTNPANLEEESKGLAGGIIRELISSKLLAP